jgi:hypothetical protein
VAVFVFFVPLCAAVRRHTPTAFKTKQAAKCGVLNFESADFQT